MVFGYVWFYVDVDIILYSRLREEREAMVDSAASLALSSSAPSLLNLFAQELLNVQ